MKPNGVGTPDHRALCYMVHIPRKMLQLHGDDHLAQYVLHDLAGEQCLNFNKAAYFVDNPDFDCMKGVAGYSRTEACLLPANFWQSQEPFTEALQQSEFNKAVRTLLRASHKKGTYADEKLVKEVAHELGLNKPEYCIWNMKHDNHGVLMYEQADAQDAPSKECVLSGVCLLGFTPIY